MKDHLLVWGGSDWRRQTEDVLPGGWVAVFSDHLDLDGLRGRSAGLELRDTLVAWSPGPVTRLILLFRRPLQEPTVARQVLATGTGGIHVDGCRVWIDPAPNVTAGRWPPNVLLVHGPDCQGACQSDCPIRLLDAAVGCLASGVVQPHHRRNNQAHHGGGYNHAFGDTPLMGYGDAGGASRFYPQFRDDSELVDWIRRLICPSLPGVV